MTTEKLSALRMQAKIQNDPSPKVASSYGLYNVSKRLELYYNRTDLLDIQSVYQEGTKVCLRIPVVDDV